MSIIRYKDRLILFETLRADPLFTELSELFNDAENEGRGEKVFKIFYKTQRTLVKNLGEGCITGNYLQDYLCRLIAVEDNTFARMAEKGAFEKPSFGADESYALNLAAREIELISPLYRFDFNNIIKDTGEINPAKFDSVNIAGKAAGADKAAGATPLNFIHDALMQEFAKDAALKLASYYSKYGCGRFGAAFALTAEETGLVPVKNIDPIKMEDIVGCESQKRALIENTEILLAGFSANNMLLYGDSGTGKSSSVKALLNMYSGEGLKMINIAKDKLFLLPEIFETIEGRGMKFIIFIDDLSFEENEFEFKAFKSIIEGRVAPKPKNAVFIVTTNRKNIVKDSWADREGQDDVRRRDNMEEKRSLSDRFGITLVYSSPNKKEYLAIVRSIAGKAGLKMPDGELEAEALKWEIRHGGRSGRTARQFVDHMAGVKGIST